ncbi:Peptidase A4 family [Candidatus Desulfosporosinus infrequens]|uniref:Peptidase A4 family n=1 Tax=Candidatus Desulfosporosinus infrequens TaxID=2043169 RepID=A0A2U3L913_9FIRM|nr:Peptidase A4 family [Candidatus Desulfosporosinus infrequens]
MMKTKLKMKIASSAVLVGLGVCSLVNGVPIHTASNLKASTDILSRYHWRRPSQSSGTQGNNTNVTLPVGTQESDNWAGYIVTPASTSSQYSSVSGIWTVPDISSSQQNDAASAQWIGLGGVSSTDLLQMGTVEQIQNGQPVIEVFWEQLPSSAQNVMAVPAGSTIEATIAETPGVNPTYNFTFTVNGQTPSQTISPVTLDSDYAQAIGTSAEWISEDPSNQNNQLYPLANMGTVSYQSATVNGRPLNDTMNEVQPDALVSSNGNILIVPSSLGPDGESFTTSVPTTSVTTSTIPTLGYQPNENLFHHRGYRQQNNFLSNWGW